jgi:formate hydrogenlyase subunit 3/multisubunit Na+/H+ antiporter MnhD subunit
VITVSVAAAVTNAGAPWTVGCLWLTFAAVLAAWFAIQPAEERSQFEVGGALAGLALLAAMLFFDNLLVVISLTIIASFLSAALFSREHGPGAEVVIPRLCGLAGAGSLLIAAGLCVASFAGAAMTARSGASSSALAFSLSEIGEHAGLAAAQSGTRAGVWNQLSPWVGVCFVVGGAILSGCFPFHRPLAVAVRASRPWNRLLMWLLATTPFWALLIRLRTSLAQPFLAETYSWLLPLTQISLWLGALLVVAQGNMPRMLSAATLYASGAIATAYVSPAETGTQAATLLFVGLLPALAGLFLLFAWLETGFESADFHEFRGLAKTSPRWTAALVICVLLLCGLPGLPVYQGLWLSWQTRAALASTPPFAGPSLFAVLLPQLLFIWGWLRLLDTLLLGQPRLPTMPDALMDRADVIDISPGKPQDLSNRELLAVAGLLGLGVVIGWVAAWAG